MVLRGRCREGTCLASDARTSFGDLAANSFHVCHDARGDYLRRSLVGAWPLPGDLLRRAKANGLLRLGTMFPSTSLYKEGLSGGKAKYSHVGQQGRSMGIDVIGDVHGHADELEALLKLLGYVERAGAYRHPTNTALLLGDLIDRGPQQLKCVRIPRMMRDAGSARILMGNHEFNAIAYATPTDDALGGHLRPRSPKNAAQHAAFLGAVGVDTAQHRDAIAFFRTLPLWEEMDGLRGVHACWSVRAMDDLAASVNGDRTLTSEGAC